jgi:hypothetical protein
VEEIYDLTDDMQELLDQNNEIQEALSRTYETPEGYDDDALEQELNGSLFRLFCRSAHSLKGSQLPRACLPFSLLAKVGICVVVASLFSCSFSPALEEYMSEEEGPPAWLSELPSAAPPAAAGAQTAPATAVPMNI